MAIEILAPDLLDPDRLETENKWMARVPKEPMRNADFRFGIVHSAQTDPTIRTDMWTACRESLLFYVNTVLWTYNPKRPVNKRMPFVTWTFQDEAMLRIEHAMHGDHPHDLLIEKSREMGASWMVAAVFLWSWHFRSEESLLMVSRTQEYVDNKSNPKSLFWKIDFMMDSLPPWLTPAFSRTSMELLNIENGSVINGESTTGEIARGDRRTAILLDEFAAVQIADGYKAWASTSAATDCRIVNSTAQGSVGQYANLVKHKTISRLRLGWWLHPYKNSGLTKDGNGKWTSPWYEAEKLRMGDARMVAQELDMDLRASEASFFTEEAIEQAKVGTRPPLWRGELAYDSQTGEPERLIEDHNGRVRLWIHPTIGGRIETFGMLFALGIDISSGTGKTNSVAVIVNARTGAMIGELATPNMRPDQFAEICVALARFLRADEECTMAWEAPGPGHHFGKRVIELGYRRIWYRQTDDINGKPTLKPGWHPTKDSKRTLYSEFRAALANGTFKVPCKEVVDECRDIVYALNGWVLNVESLNVDDPSGAAMSHADRPTAAAIAWMAIRDIVTGDGPSGMAPQILPGSLAWRQRERAEKARRSSREAVDSCATAST